MDVQSLKVGDIVALTAILLSLMCPASAMDIAHNTTITLEYSGKISYPFWSMNGSVVRPGPQYRTEYVASTGDWLAILTIDGNETCGIMNASCRVEGQTVYTVRLNIEGPLPPPENVTISSQNSSTQLRWKPPYYTMNSESDVIHVNPHITHYTVYTIDAYDSSRNHSVNTTETSFTPKHNIYLCSMYQVSAWNSGGEGELSEPVQESTPRVPVTIAAENVSVSVAVEPNVLHIHIDINVVCTSRIPEFFLFTLMISGGNILRQLNMSYVPGQSDADFTISLPPSVDVCSLHVKISAGNSAGMSAPSEAVEVGCSHSSTDSSTAAFTTTTATSTGSEGGNERQAGISTTLIAIIIAVTAVTLVGVLMAATAGIICYRNYKRRKIDPSNPPDGNNYYSKSPSLGGPVSLYKPPVTEVIYCASQQNTSNSTARSSSTVDPPAPAGNPHLVYAQLNVKQTQVQPPANDDPVQYAQIEHQN